MNKVTTAALAGLLAVTAGVQASDSRWNGFGSANAYIADVQDIWTLPGVLASHGDTTYFELGKTGATNQAVGNVTTVVPTNNAWGGVHGKVGGGVLGLWFNRTSNTLSDIEGGFNVPGAYAGGAAATAAFNLSTTSKARLANQLDVLYAFELSDATTLGFGISRGVNSKTVETVTTTTSNDDTTVSDLGISLGLEQKEVGPISLLEVGLQYGMRGNNYTNKGTQTNKLTVDGTRIALRVGGDMAGENGAFSRFELGFATSSLSAKSALNTAATSTDFSESKNSAMLWNLGYAAGMSSDKGMGLMGLMLKSKGQSRDEANFGSAVNKSDWNTMNLQVTTAGEAKINNWLTFRAGLESDIFYSKTSVTEAGATGATTKTTTNNNAHAGIVGDENALASMGVSFTLGDLVLDGVLNQGLLYSGPYLLSGIPGGVSSQVSLTWPWGGSKQ